MDAKLEEQSVERVPELLDCTLRDAGYAINFQFSAGDIRKISAGLVSSGIRRIEVGHGLGLGASSAKYGLSFESDEYTVEVAKDSCQELAKVGVFCIPQIAALSDIKKIQRAGADFIRVGIDVIDYPGARAYLEHAKSLGLEVFFNPMKSYAVSHDEFGSIAATVETWGASDWICLVDSAGCMTPNDVARYVTKTKDNCSLSIGFHGHNNLGLANANAMRALECGASSVDSTLSGMGRSAGNAQTEIMAHLMNDMFCAVKGWSRLDRIKLLDLIEADVHPLMLKKQGFEPIDVLFGMTKFHSGYLGMVKRIAQDHGVGIFELILEISNNESPAFSVEECTLIAKDIKRITTEKYGR